MEPFLNSQAPFTRYNLLSNQFDNRLYRVNGVSAIQLFQPQKAAV